MTFPLRSSIASILRNQIESGGWYVDENNKIRRAMVIPMQETPWRYFNVHFACVKWFDLFHHTLTQGTLVHSHCQSCFKVCVVPRALVELVAIEAFQDEHSKADPNVHCKCGADIREFTNQLWLAVWYTRSLEEAQQRYAEVHDFLTQVYGDKAPDHYIKLACTEFERNVGPSDQYTVTKAQLELEKKLDEALDFEPYEQSMAQPQLIIDRVHEMWVNWAFAHGDKTYLTLTNGVPLERPAVRYPTGQEGTNGEE
jgi:hypothetical protein